MGRMVRGWWVVVCVVGIGCNCDPHDERDGGVEPVPETLRWPDGARLTIDSTTATSASVTWPAALGPVSGYRVRVDDRDEETQALSRRIDGLTVGHHEHLQVVAFSADGSTTTALHAEVAAASGLVIPDGDISTDFCGANAFLKLGVDIPCDVFSVVIGHVRTRDGVGVPGMRVSVLEHPEWGD